MRRSKIWKWMRKRPVVAAAIVIVLVGWMMILFWPAQLYRQAFWLDRVHCHRLAAASFVRFANIRPENPLAVEALVRAADIEAKLLRHWSQARVLYERAAHRYVHNGVWANRARESLLECPDYFPLRAGMKWTHVDSQTGGRNMKLELEAHPASKAGSSHILGAYFAGKSRFKDYRRTYEKKDWAVWETEGKDRVRILKYPFISGMTWSGEREGKPVEFQIVSSSESVMVRAGRFYECLKIREFQPGSPAWKYDYYAPDVGRIKTTISGPDFENPNTELLSFSTVKVE